MLHNRIGMAAMLLMLGVWAIAQANGQTPAPNLAVAVTAAEIESVRHKLSACVATEVRNLPREIVAMRLDLDPNGSVTQVELVNPKYLSDPTYRAAGDALKRIMLNPRCQRWPFSSDNYQRWRRVTYHFDWRDYGLADEPPQQRAPTSTAGGMQGTIDKWQEANSVCRGGTPGEARTDKACRDRSVLQIELEAFGYCYGKEGEAGYQSAWHRCGPSSLRSANATPTQNAGPRSTNEIAQAPATANLPGPASDGWYVIMGVVRSGGIAGALLGANGEVSSAIAEMQLKQLGYRCVGGVVPAKDRYIKSFPYEFSFEVVITQRFGPYDTVEEGNVALRNAGWRSVKDGMWTASSGCEAKTRQ